MYRMRSGIKVIRRVYNYKRDYLPTITVISVKQTRKGWHVILEYSDRERQRCGVALKYHTLMLQYVLGSDVTRGLFDDLRILRNDSSFNLMFDYKNGMVFRERSNRYKDIISAWQSIT